MSISIEDIMKNPALLDDLDFPAQKCAECGIEIQESLTGKRFTEKGCTCSGCYYKEMGDEIESRPIAIGRRQFRMTTFTTR